MKDRFNRKIDYLRLSVTDLCNLRCIYCMPEEGVKKLSHDEILSVEEIERIVSAAAGLGISKVRITGGEPLVRKGIEEIVRRINAIPGIRETVLTTNALLLPQKADALRAAGIKRLNISLDSLDPKKYTELTRGGRLEDALHAIDTAVDKGFSPIKLNVVLMGGINDGEIRKFIEFADQKQINLRFIEVMPVGECAGWSKERFVNTSKVIKTVPELEYSGDDGVSRIYKLPGSSITVGLISPISSHFCLNCNKIRITADGRLKSCLHHAAEINLMDKTGEELIDAICMGIYEKPMRHRLNENAVDPGFRNMNQIGG